MVKRNIKKIILYLFRYHFIKINVKCKKKWLGSHYGGFYVHSNVINNDSIVYSFGIGEDITFDLDIINNYNCSVFAFDPTPKSISWINTQTLPDNFHFTNIGISNVNDTVNFFLPKNELYVSGSLSVQSNIDIATTIEVEVRELRQICLMLNHDRIDILKIDIEGSEYDIIDNILQSNIYIGQILLEFHDRFYKNGIEKTKTAILKLRRAGYEIFATSDNFQEISFIKKEIISI
jgi:FkbM family methyltransferase